MPIEIKAPDLKAIKIPGLIDRSPVSNLAIKSNVTPVAKAASVDALVPRYLNANRLIGQAGPYDYPYDPSKPWSLENRPPDWRDRFVVDSGGAPILDYEDAPHLALTEEEWGW